MWWRSVGNNAELGTRGQLHTFTHLKVNAGRASEKPCISSLYTSIHKLIPGATSVHIHRNNENASVHHAVGDISFGMLRLYQTHARSDMTSSRPCRGGQPSLRVSKFLSIEST